MTIKDTVILTVVLVGIAANLAFQESLAADGDDSWELKQLHKPSQSLRVREDAGRVTIYDGVVVTEVDRAMDEQFDRIGSMMFVRTKWPTEEGDYEEDSDCD
jgi:hypothetical protein